MYEDDEIAYDAEERPAIDPEINLLNLQPGEAEYLQGDGYDSKRLEFLRDTKGRQGLSQGYMGHHGINDEEKQFEYFCKYHRPVKTMSEAEKLKSIDIAQLSSEVYKNPDLRKKSPEEILRNYMRYHNFSYDKPDGEGA